MGGFTRCEERVEKSEPEVDTTQLEAVHEEADMYMLRHCVEASSIVAAVRDTVNDVPVLLLAHVDKIQSSEVCVAQGLDRQTEEVHFHLHNPGALIA